MNLENHVEYSELIERASEFKRIFFYRICGTGMGAAAILLKEKGHEIEGGDTAFNPPMSTYLDSTGIKCHDLKDFDYEYLKSFDLIVVGNVLSRNANEARILEQLGIPFTSFPSALGAFVLKDVNVIGVAGTHGKTTTTYLLAQFFENLGFNPGYFVGGVIEGRPSATVGDGKYFFIESDEYDSAYFEKISKFRRYEINDLIITSLEFDHGDIFNDIEDIKDQFRALIPNIPKSIIFDNSYAATLELKEEYPEKDWREYSLPRIIQMDENGTTFELNGNEYQTNVVGNHNILNLTSGILLAIKEGISISKIQMALHNLSLVKRRQENRGKYKGSTVIDDFAHHPRAVALTVDAIKVKYPSKNIVVVMEPNSATARSSMFQNEFSESLKNADKVIVAKPSLSTTISTLDDLDSNKIVEDIKKYGVQGSVATNLDELRDQIDCNLDPNSLLLVLSNGTCLGLWKSSFVDELV